MAFIDELKIHLSAGRGGDGVVRWLHEKGKEYGGPSGGNGGQGGSVFAESVRDLGILAKYRSVKELRAGAGAPGENKTRRGKNGTDLVFKLPIGSIIENLETGRRVELLRDGEKILLLSGGRGGLGNEHFKSSTNIRPREATLGEAGERANFKIELQLIADIGLIGLPNAGKTSLLNALTAAGAKVGDYAFTTLEPNLGAFQGFVLADIPGLIEGASAGKGLGDKFLRHIRRTKLLVHCISLQSSDLKNDYETIRGELAKFDQTLVEKPEIVLLTKSDLADKVVISKAEKLAKKFGGQVFTVSVLDDPSLKSFSDSLVKLLRA